MGRFTEHADVATPPAETFDYVTDQEQVAAWNEHVQSVEVVGGGPVGVGSQLRQHRRRGDREFALTFRVTEHDPPRRHAVEGTVFGLETTMAFDIEPRPAGSRVTMSATVRGRGPRRLLAPVVTREMRKSSVAALEALRRRLLG